MFCKSYASSDELCRVLGWGDTHGNQTYPGKLLQAYVPIRKTEECKKVYAKKRKSYKHLINIESNICAGIKGKDSCFVRMTCFY